MPRRYACADPERQLRDTIREAVFVSLICRPHYRRYTPTAESRLSPRLDRMTGMGPARDSLLARVVRQKQTSNYSALIAVSGPELKFTRGHHAAAQLAEPSIRCNCEVGWPLDAVCADFPDVIGQQTLVTMANSCVAAARRFRSFSTTRSVCHDSGNIRIGLPAESRIDRIGTYLIAWSAQMFE